MRKRACPLRKREKPCPACNAAERIVARLDAVANATHPDGMPEDQRRAWRMVWLERLAQECRMEIEMARRADAVPKMEWIADEFRQFCGCGIRHGLGWTGMGADGDGSDRDVDANGWYSNVRRMYEEQGA